MQSDMQDNDNLHLMVKADPSGKSKYAQSYFQCGNFFFPEEGWIDFSDFAAGWRQKLEELERYGYCKIFFIRGPHHVAITRVGTNYEFEFMTWYEDGTFPEKTLILTKERSIDNIIRYIDKLIP